MSSSYSSGVGAFAKRKAFGSFNGGHKTVDNILNEASQNSSEMPQSTNFVLASIVGFYESVVETIQSFLARWPALSNLSWPVITVIVIGVIVLSITLCMGIYIAYRKISAMRAARAAAAAASNKRTGRAMGAMEGKSMMQMSAVKKYFHDLWCCIKCFFMVLMRPIMGHKPCMCMHHMMAVSGMEKMEKMTASELVPGGMEAHKKLIALFGVECKTERDLNNLKSEVRRVAPQALKYLKQLGKSDTVTTVVARLKKLDIVIETRSL